MPHDSQFPDPLLLSPEDVATVLRLPVQAAVALMASGEIESWRVPSPTRGVLWRTTYKKVEDFVDDLD